MHHRFSTPLMTFERSSGSSPAIPPGCYTEIDPLVGLASLQSLPRPCPPVCRAEPVFTDRRTAGGLYEVCSPAAGSLRRPVVRPVRSAAGRSRSGPRHLQGISPSWRLEIGMPELQPCFRLNPPVGFSLQSLDPPVKRPALSGLWLSCTFDRPEPPRRMVPKRPGAAELNS